jgi:general secretion pathway protein G
MKSGLVGFFFAVPKGVLACRNVFPDDGGILFLDCGTVTIFWALNIFWRCHFYPPFAMKTAYPIVSRKAAGYTLMEIMLVLAIISVLVGAGIYYLTGSLDVAKEQRVDADIQTITTQLRTYEMQNLFLPSTAQGLEALVRRPSSEPQPKRWRQLMKKVVDPWGTVYQYKNPGVKNPDSFDVYSLGPDRVESDDDIGNWETKS